MSSYLLVMVRFLDPEPSFHGRRDGGEWEWPPSPLRLLQSLVAAAADRWRGQQFEDYAVPALAWLERLAAPEIVAPRFEVGTAVRIAVPNNDMDVPAEAWATGKDPVKPHRPVDLKTMKSIQPVWIRRRPGADSKDLAVHYLYPLADADRAAHLGTLRDAARSVTHLGWGVDMATGDAAVVTQEQADALKGERWRPADASGDTHLRVPRAGTLDALTNRHTAFLGRLPSAGGFAPVPPLTAFDTVAYRRDTDPAPRPWVGFGILTPDGGGNAAFSTPRRCGHVAAWVRHAAGVACKEWDDAAAFVHGHAPDGTQARGDGADHRLLFLPLPTVNHALGRVESIRRVLVAAPPGCRDRVTELRRRLAGCDLVRLPDEGSDSGDRVVGLLNLLPSSDWVLKQYVEPARVWTTVTPVLRPGFDDRDPSKAEGLLRRAFEHAGFPPGLVGQATLEWRSVGFRAGVDHARRYEPPGELRAYPRFHVRVTWPLPVAGPIAVGAGRYRGYGVFVADSER